MFNDLNQNNSQSRPAVDDIFAETDKTAQPSGAVPSASGIETHRIGLTAGAGGDEPVEKTGGSWFKIAVIAIVVVILALGGYLVYSRFFQAAPETDVVGGLQNNNQNLQADTPATTTPTSTPAEEETASTSEEVIPLIPGVNAPVIETPTTTPVEEVTPAAPADTDQDGLSDEEENTFGTNVNIVDTDVDGLSDYEELKIYGTNPLAADSDGDTYPDGNEVRNGYNPLGAGKLQAN